MALMGSDSSRAFLIHCLAECVSAFGDAGEWRFIAGRRPRVVVAINDT